MSTWSKFKGRKLQVTDILDEKCGGVSPIEELVKIASDPNTSNRLKFDIWRTISEYLYPKRKAVQHSGDDSQPVKFNFLFNEEDENSDN